MKYNYNYSATRLTVATQQTFLQVSQSGYANLINGHASLQSPTGKWHNNELLKTCRFVKGGRYLLEDSAALYSLYTCNINVIGLYIYPQLRK